MKEFTRIGLDLAKNYFQVHALAETNGVTERHKLSRIKVLLLVSLRQRPPGRDSHS